MDHEPAISIKLLDSSHPDLAPLMLLPMKVSKEDQQGTVDSAVLGSAMLIAFGHCFLPTIIVKIRRRSAETNVRDFHGRQLSEDRAIYQDDHWVLRVENFVESRGTGRS